MKGIPTDDDAFGKGQFGPTDAASSRLSVADQEARKHGGWDLFNLGPLPRPPQALHPLNPKCAFPVVGA